VTSEQRSTTRLAARRPRRSAISRPSGRGSPTTSWSSCCWTTTSRSTPSRKRGRRHW